MKHSLNKILLDASSKGFNANELEIIKTVYDIGMSEFVACNHYSLFNDKEGSLVDKQYFKKQKAYAYNKSSEYVNEIMSSRRKQ